MLKKKDDRKIAIYSRKSKFTGKGDSIGNQINTCMQCIKRYHEDIDEKDILIFQDEGYSGKNTNRPQFQCMMKLCRKKEIKEIYSYRIDRMGRNLSDSIRLIDEWNSLGVKFCSATENIYDTVSPHGKFLVNIFATMAQYERETIAERVRDNMMALAKTGRWLGGTTPTGYESEKVSGNYKLDGKVRSMYRLNLIEEEARKIRLIGAKFLETNSLTKVETYLLLNNIKTKTNKNFSRLAVREILQNPVYVPANEEIWNYFKNKGVEIFSEKEEFDGKYGVMAYNKTSQNKGNLTCKNDMKDWIVAVGNHEPIFTSHDWIKMQKMIEQNKPKSYRQERSNIALLSGLLRCGDCGSYMRPKTARGLTERGDKKFYYLCQMKENSKGINCSMKNPQGNLLDEFVCEEVKKLSKDNSEFIHQLRRAKKTISCDWSLKVDEIKALEKQINENKKEINSRVDTLAKCEGSIASEYLLSQIEDLHEKNAQVLKKVEELKRQKESSEVYDNQFDMIEEMLRSFSKSFDTMSMEHKRNALRLIIEEIVWDGENVHIYFFGSRAEESQSDATTVGLQMNSS